tara:strand:+ start:1908 stop:2642 length:735 start_codon:yes stop_codon:yes gene_type:complete
MFLDTSLYFKTFFILISELGILFGCTYWVVYSAKKAYENNTAFMGVTFRLAVNMKNQPDLVPSDSVETYKIFTWLTLALLVSGVLVTYVSVSQMSPLIGVICMSINAISFGIILGFVMLDMDENDGMRAIYITLLVTLITAIIGTYGNIDFANANFGLFLFVGLLCLLGFQTARLFMEFSRKASRYWAIFGAFLFSMYLLFDFNLLMQLSERTNDWNTALFMAYSIYLDIINLILQILDAMSNS